MAIQLSRDLTWNRYVAGVRELRPDDMTQEDKVAAVVPPQEAVPAAPSVEVKETPGQRIANAARKMVEKLKLEGAVYVREDPREWDNYKAADCSKFVQLSLELAGFADLFGRPKAATQYMRQEIEKLSGTSAFRKQDPKAGDICMWTQHVAILTEVPAEGDTKYRIAQMGKTGANEYSVPMLQFKKDSVEVGIEKTIKKLGTGEFLGFWTTPVA